MADSLTSIFSFTKPEVNVSTTWPTSLNGDLDTLDDLLARPKQTFNSPTVGATTTCDLSLARVFVFTVSQATTIAFTNVPSASFFTRTVLLLTNYQAFAVTWPGSVVWLRNYPPVGLLVGVNAVELFTKDGGTTWYGQEISAPQLIFDAPSASGQELVLLRRGGVNKFRVDSAGAISGNIGTSATIARVPLVVLTSSATTGSTGEVSLASFSVPANALATNNDAVRVKIYGNAVTQAAQLRVKFGASYVLNIAGGNNVGAAQIYQGEVVIRRSGAATQVSGGVMLVGTAIASNERATPAETLSGAVLVDIRGNTAVGGGVANLDLVTMEVLSA